MSLQDNLRYRELDVSAGVHIPDVGVDYPEDDPYARLMPAPIVRQLTFDDTYPYLDTSFGFKFQRFLAYLLVFGPYFLVNKLVYGVKFTGRDVLRRHRDDFKKGIISVSNHCYRLDGMAVSEALLHTLWIPMLSDHLAGPNWWHLKYFGGIPLSDGSLSAMKKFNDAFDWHIAHGGWIHVFPEARSWPFYKPVRPWQKGAFTMAYKYNVPVLPVNLSYRPRIGIHKLFGKKEMPLITVNIGEPIFPDVTQPRRPEVQRLLCETFDSVCRLGGITRNSWPSEWKTE